MADGQIFEEPRKEWRKGWRKGWLNGWLARLVGGLSLGWRTTNRRQIRRESLNLTVPVDKADVVRAAVEQWLRSHGIAVAVVGDEPENGKVKIHAKLDGADASRLELSADAVQSELQALIEASIR